MRKILAASLVATALTAPAASAAILTVDTTVDELDGTCSSAPDDCSLRDALAAAGFEDEIVFALPAPSPWTITLVPGLGPLVVDEVLNINGPGIDLLTISGSDATRVLEITPQGSTIIRDLTLRDGRATLSSDKDGGCVLASGDVLFRDVRFESCQAWNGGVVGGSGLRGGEGGAIVNVAGFALQVENCEFLSNVAGTGDIGPSGQTAGPGGRGGAIANFGILSVLRSTFDGNLAGLGGSPNGDGGDGGAIANLSAGTLLIRDSTFTGNRSGDGRNVAFGTGADGQGGALLLGADATLNNVTLSGNAIGSAGSGTAATGGGIQVTGGVTRLRNVTVASNTANGNGGGIVRSGGTLRVRNSVVGLNAGAGVNDDCFTNAAGSLISEGFNVVRINNGCAASFVATGDQVGTSGSPLDPVLGPLADNGGPTRTRALLAGSPAIDAGETPNCQAWNPSSLSDFDLLVDQRGSPRPVDGDGDTVVACDPGAYEAPFGTSSPQLLTVNLAGGGSGSVTSAPAGISCPGDCSESYPQGTPVTLTATADPGSVFTGWSGDCTGTGTCDLTMDQDHSATATFEQLFTLDVSVVGSGNVTSAPAGISCPGDCTEDYVDGTPVTLTATANPGWVFSGWSGDCAGTGTCLLTMSQDHSATATFAQLFTLDVTVVGSGTVTSAPAGISCPGDCTQDYPDGTPVTLTATADPGSVFTGWSGDCSGTGTCDLTMDQDHSATATFVDLFTLTVSIPGGGGSVTSVPSGISCPGDCSEDYQDGTPVTLTATPSPGFQFQGWSGACTGTGPCMVTMTQDRSVTATFQAIAVVFTLDVTVTGPGTGSVTSMPAGIACPADCTEDYLDGTPVTLTATPTGESYFVGWSGDCTGTGSCMVTMDQAHAATATFDTMPFLDGFESGDTSAWSNTVP